MAVQAQFDPVIASPRPTAPAVGHEACSGTARILGEPELGERIAALPGWSLRDNRLNRSLHFDSFAAAFAFVTGVALLAERRNHHPAICVEKREVEFTLWTRKMAAITVLDVEFAEAIERLVEARR